MGSPAGRRASSCPADLPGSRATSVIDGIDMNHIMVQYVRWTPSPGHLRKLESSLRSTCNLPGFKFKTFRHLISSLAGRATMASTDQSAPLKQRSVVSSFIIKYPNQGEEGKPLVALFKRSGKVSTYQWVPPPPGEETYCL